MNEAKLDQQIPQVGRAVRVCLCGGGLRLEFGFWGLGFVCVWGGGGGATAR